MKFSRRFKKNPILQISSLVFPGSPFDVPKLKYLVFENYAQGDVDNELFLSNRKLRKQLKEAEECITRLQEQLQLENE